MKTNYTIEILETMIEGMMKAKEYKGFRKISNGPNKGLYEDCLGNMFAMDVEQKKFNIAEGEDSHELYSVKLKLKLVNLFVGV